MSVRRAPQARSQSNVVGSFAVTASTGVSSVPDISDHNALAGRVSKLEQSQTDMDTRVTRVEARLESVVVELKAVVAAELGKVTSTIDVLQRQMDAEQTKYDRVWAKCMELEAHINKQPVQSVQPPGFQENDSPFPRSTMGRPRPEF